MGHPLHIHLLFDELWCPIQPLTIMVMNIGGTGRVSTVLPANIRTSK